MNNSHGSSSLRFGFPTLLLGALSLLACDQSRSVGKLGDAGPAGGGSAVEAGASAAGGNTGVGGPGGTHADAAVDGHVCPPLTDVYCSSYITDEYGCMVCAPGGTGGGAGGVTSKGGSGGAGTTGAGGSSGVAGSGGASKTGTGGTSGVAGRGGAGTTGAGGSSGAAGRGGAGTTGAGGSSGIAGSGGAGTTGAGGSSGVAGSSGTVKACARHDTGDATCRSRNYPPLAYFCEVPARPTSTACVMYNGIGSGDFYCCPDQYAACPDSPPTNDAACTGALGCSYGSHPDPTCRTVATCKNGTWQVTALPSRCSDPQLPSTCPAAAAAGSACSSHGLNCYYGNGSFCSCTNCSIEDSAASCGTTDTWRCWSPPGSDCPTYYPNLGTTCTLPANTTCRYTCAARTSCSAAGVWVDLGNLCPN